MRLGRIACVVAVALVFAGPDAWSQEKPAEVRLWTGDVMAPFRDFDFEHGGGPVAPVRIVGARNGTFSGKVVIGSTRPIKGVSASITDLAAAGARIPASQVRTAFPPYSARGAWLVVPKAVLMFDDLLATPTESSLITQSPDRKRIDYVPMNHAFQPVWVTVEVPKDAKPGEYSATLTVKVEGARGFEVPVGLKVHDWTLPDPNDYATFVELIQSPDSVAMQYGLPMWSDRHFELMGKSLALAGGIGSRSVYVPLISETNMGNDESMVRWVPKADGTYDYDFTVMERYLDAVEKHFGRPRIVGLIVWDVYLEGGNFENLAGGGPGVAGEEAAREDWKNAQGKGPQVSALVDGKLTKITLPQYSDPRSAALWKPMLEQLRDRLKKRGLAGAMMLGIATDYVPTEAVVSHFAGIFPDVPWIHHAHSFYGGRDRKIASGGAPVGYASHVWCHRERLDPSKQRHFGWNPEGKTAGLIAAHYHRGLSENGAVATYRLLAEMNLAGDRAGFGRMGADFWPVIKDRRGRVAGRVSDGRFPKSMWRNLDIRVAMLAAGPDGPAPTARYEMMREGVQECEARIFIEKALLDRDASGKLGKELGEECQSVLDERTRAIARAFLTPGRDGKRPGDSVSEEGYDDFLAWNWQQRSDQLYAAAAKVAAKLGRR
jgi:hypothetical protein